jgi:integrase
MRQSELFNLTWDRVDMSRGVLKVEITKGGKRREVPMRQQVYEILSVRPEPRRGRVWPNGYNRNAFEDAVEQAKLDSPFTWHDCRHHFASWFMMNGGGLFELKNVGGWGSLKWLSGTRT